MISEDEWDMLLEKGHTDDEIMEMNEERKNGNWVKLQALQAFMETDIFKQLPKDSQRVVEQDYNRLEQAMYCIRMLHLFASSPSKSLRFRCSQHGLYV